MINSVRIQFLKSILLIPGMSLLSRLVYSHAQKLLIKNFSNHPEIKDILLTSKLDSPDFIFGKSDLNFIIIAKDISHPKLILKEFREFIKRNWTTKLTINTIYVPIVTEEELETNLIRNYLTRSTYQDHVQWYSLFQEQTIPIERESKHLYFMRWNSFQSLDYFLFKGQSQKETRSLTKNIYWPIVELSKFYPNIIRHRERLRRSFSLIHLFMNLSRLFRAYFIKEAWSCLLNDRESNITQESSSNSTPPSIDSNEIKYFESLLELDFIEDITLSPSLIQNSSTEIQGKIFIDFIINSKILEKNILNRLVNLQQGIQSLNYTGIKYRLRFIPKELYILKFKHSFFAFPLESLYRSSKMFSFKQIDYSLNIDRTDIRSACTNFFIMQFMRFRSLEQKTDLIGSKFIKSLNLMYKYYLVLSYLKDDEVKFESRDKHIRDHLTPQFSDIAHSDIVSEEDWLIIKAQLIYLLKGIREELSIKDPSLKNLKF